MGMGIEGERKIIVSSVSPFFLKTLMEVALEELLTKQEVAEILKVGVKTVDYFISVREIPFVRLRKRCIRFKKSRVEEYLNENEEGGAHDSSID